MTKKVEPPPAPKKEAAPPPPQAGTMADWEDPAAWTMMNGVWLHKGAGFVPYKLPPKGVFAFTVQLVKGGGFLRSGHIRWAVNYKNPKNYALYEMDNKNFWARVVTDGKTFERTHTQLKDLEKQKSFTIQIDITPDMWSTKCSWTGTGSIWIRGPRQGATSPRASSASCCRAAKKSAFRISSSRPSEPAGTAEPAMKGSSRRRFLAAAPALIGLTAKADRRIEGQFVNEAFALGHRLRDHSPFQAPGKD